MSSQSTDDHGHEKRSHSGKCALVKRDYDQYQVAQVRVAYEPSDAPSEASYEEHNAPEDRRPRRPAWDNSFDNQDAWSDNERWRRRRRHDRNRELDRNRERDREHKHRKRGVFLAVLGVVTSLLVCCFMHCC